MMTAFFSRRGFSLIEAAIVLGIAGLVLGGIWAATSAVMTNKRISDMASGILTTCANAQSLFPVSATPAGAGATAVVEPMLVARSFPQDWPRNSFWGINPPLSSTAVEAYLNHQDEVFIGTPVGGMVYLAFQDLPPQACQKLLSLIDIRTKGLVAAVWIGRADSTEAWHPAPYAGRMADDCLTNTTAIGIFCAPGI